jgi:hypothetical protein
MPRRPSDAGSGTGATGVKVMALNAAPLAPTVSE